MKLMKAMKQLKFWSRKKKRKKTEHVYYKLTHDQFTYAYNPPPRAPPPRQLQPPPVCECHFCGPLEPSAPPLPPWLESTNQTYSAGLHYCEVDPFSSMSPKHQQEQSQDLKFDIANDCIPTEESCLSHQNSWTDPFWGVDQPSSSDDHSIISISQEETPNNWTDPFWSVDQPGSSDDHCISISQEEMPDASLLSNQQLMSQNLECGPLVQYKRQKGGTGNMFGCFMDVGGLLLRCFIPCFRNSEQLAFQNSSISRRVVPDEDERKKIV